MKLGLEKIHTPNKHIGLILLFNIILFVVLIYEAWFLKDLYTTLSGQFEQSGNTLHVSRINLDTYHKVDKKYNDLVDYQPDQNKVNNPFGK